MYIYIFTVATSSQPTQKLPPTKMTQFIYLPIANGHTPTEKTSKKVVRDIEFYAIY